MKRYLLLWLMGFVAGLSPLAHAQTSSGADEMSDRLMSKKIAFLTAKINLTPEQAKQFWPIYNEYEDKRKANRKEYRSLRDACKAGYTEEEARKMIERVYVLRQNDYTLDKAYSDKFLKILSAKQVVELMSAEREFNMSILRKFREGHHGKGGPDGPPKGGE